MLPVLLSTLVMPKLMQMQQKAGEQRKEER